MSGVADALGGFGRGVQGGLRDLADDGEPSPAAVAAALQGELLALVRRVKAAGGRLPVGAVPLVRAIEDVLRPLLRHVERQPANAEELFQMTAIVREHLPEAVEHYLSLPERYATTARGVEGRTPGDELVAQLRLLHEGSEQLARAVYDADAQQLAIGRRFLDTKFRRSDLDL